MTPICYEFHLLWSYTGASMFSLMLNLICLLTMFLNLPVGMVGGATKTIEGGGEFSMQQEDFPALPGAARKL